jgi:hypothetical protein
MQVVGRPFGPNPRYFMGGAPKDTPPPWSFINGKIVAITQMGTAATNWRIFESLKRWIKDVHKVVDTIAIPTSYLELKGNPEQRMYPGKVKQTDWIVKRPGLEWGFQYLMDVYTVTDEDTADPNLQEQAATMIGTFNRLKLRFDSERVGVEKIKGKPHRLVYFGFGEEIYDSHSDSSSYARRYLGYPFSILCKPCTDAAAHEAKKDNWYDAELLPACGQPIPTKDPTKTLQCHKWNAPPYALAPAKHNWEAENPHNYEPRGETHFRTLEKQFLEAPQGVADWQLGEEHNNAQLNAMFPDTLVSASGGGSASAGASRDNPITIDAFFDASLH